MEFLLAVVFIAAIYLICIWLLRLETGRAPWPDALTPIWMKRPGSHTDTRPARRRIGG